MRPKKVTDEVVLKGLLKVMTTHGFEGAKLDDLSAATGLNRASLYNRFPDGKTEMASAILTYIEENLRTNLAQLLADSTIEPQVRLSEGLEHIRTFYRGGEQACILRALSLDQGMSFFGDQIKESMELWIESFKVLGKDFGQDDAKAASNATKSLMLIQGGLVVAKGTANTQSFELALQEVKALYLE